LQLDRRRVPAGLVEHQTHKWHHLISRSRTSQVRSPFSRCGGKKGHPPTMRTADVRRRRRIPEWLAASGLTIGKQSTSFQRCSSMSHKDSMRLFKGKNTPRASPVRVGFPHGESHRLDPRRPGRPSRRPTGEASGPGSLKAPFQPPTQSKQTHPIFPSEQVNNTSLG